MKRTIALLFAVLLGLGGLAPTVSAARVFISIGDRPYYSHGPYYWSGRVRYVWVPGHWARRHHHRVWIHGYYTTG